MGRKHKKQSSPSPSDDYSGKEKKRHKRHRDDSSSDEEDDPRQKQHKHIRDREREKSHRSVHHDGDDGDERGGRSSNGREDRKSKHHRGRSDRDRDDRNQRHGGRSRSLEFDPNMRVEREIDNRNFREQERERSQHDRDRRDSRRRRDEDGGDFGLNANSTVKIEGEKGDKENEEEKQKPNFELSGKLTEDTNTFRGVVIKYNEPQEAMKPKRRWRLYPFKGNEALPVLHIHRQSAYLLGRDRRIADIPVDHPSCSKQQAVLQFRALPYTRADGTPGRRVRPYIIDLESANGTYLNGDKVEAKRYYELKEKDVIKFGFSSREYVVLHDSVDLSEITQGEDMEEI